MKHKIIVVTIILQLGGVAFGQSIGRYSLNSLGNSVSKTGVSISQTVGQSGSVSVVSHDNGHQIHQGFQQASPAYSKSHNKALDFTVYPNPNKGVFSIEFEERQAGIMDLELYDSQGRIVARNRDWSTVNIDFGYLLPSGVYTLKLTNETGKTGLSKIIILP